MNAQFIPPDCRCSGDVYKRQGIHYPIPLHRQRAYESLGYKVGDFPVTEKVASQIVSLPMFPNLTAEQQGRVVNEVARFPQAAMAATK